MSGCWMAAWAGKPEEVRLSRIAPTATPGANYFPTLQNALARGTVLQVDQAASANQALLRKLNERSQNSNSDRGERLRAGGDLEEGASTTAKFTQHFTNYKRERV